MDERVVWLRAAMDHVEQTAKNAVPCAYPYDRDPPTGRWHATDGGRVADENGETVTFNEGAPTDEQRAHIALHCPETELARVEADRRILAIYEREAACEGECAEGEARAWLMEQVVDEIVVAYRHVPVPGFREEWTA